MFTSMYLIHSIIEKKNISSINKTKLHEKIQYFVSWLCSYKKKSLLALKQQFYRNETIMSACIKYFSPCHAVIFNFVKLTHIYFLIELIRQFDIQILINKNELLPFHWLLYLYYLIIRNFHLPHNLSHFDIHPYLDFTQI